MAEGEVRRVWCELLPHRELIRPELLAGLARRRITVLLAVTPPDLVTLPAVLEALGRAEVDVGLWPMVSDAEGRWASVQNATVFRRHLDRVLAAATVAACRPVEVVLDLEPPIRQVRRALAARPLSLLRALRPLRAHRALGILADMVADVRAAGILPSAAVVPLVLWDPPGQVGGWQRLLGTPVDALGLDRLHVMLYSSLLVGYTRGALRRADARSLVHAMSRSAIARYGARASISLGLAGGGALGDEHPYGSIEELRDDVALARGAGARDLALHELGGVLGREDPDAWLDILCGAPAVAAPPFTRRSRALVTAGRLAARIG